MKQNILKPVNIILAFLITLSSCKKQPDVGPSPIPGNDPPPTGQKASVRFETNIDLSGQPYHSSNLKAIVSIKNANGALVLSDSMLSVDLSGKVTTQLIELPLGTYKVTGFRLEHGSVNTHFAAPIEGSPKASFVQNPLSVNFVVEKGTVPTIQLALLKVQNADKPEDYGYPSGAFDYGQSNSNPFLKVKLKAIMQIGNVLYDSIPASLKLRIWGSHGEITTSYSSLKAGVNTITIPKAASKYEFTMSKWGTSDMISLNRNEIDEVTIYTLGGSKAAKKLKSEIVALDVNGTYVAQSKNEYIYDANGNLSKIEYWLKRSDNTPYISMTERFEHTGSSVNKIIRYGEQNEVLSNTMFTHDNQGKVIRMVKQENDTQATAKVEYFHYTKPEVTIHYDFPGTMDTDYYSDYSGGNTVSSTSRRTNGDTEFGWYEYDFNINPYKHMNWPDFLLSHTSKNNLVLQRKQYMYSFPINEPYSFIYTYDADGYPTSLITSFKSYLTGKHVFSTKKIFTY